MLINDHFPKNFNLQICTFVKNRKKKREFVNFAFSSAQFTVVYVGRDLYKLIKFIKYCSEELVAITF